VDSALLWGGEGGKVLLGVDVCWGGSWVVRGELGGGLRGGERGKKRRVAYCTVSLRLKPGERWVCCEVVSFVEDGARV
jgi:hypothetical protein